MIGERSRRSNSARTCKQHETAPKVRPHFGQIGQVKKTTILLLVVFAFTVVFNVPVVNATIFWSNPNGSLQDYDYSNGGSDKCLFGDPDIVGNTFVFDIQPGQFRAESQNGVNQITSDRLQVDIIAHPGKVITGIRIGEWGYYDIQSDALAMASGAVFLTNLKEYEVISGNFDTNPNMPITNPSAGLWLAGVEIDALGWTKMRLVLNNNLIAMTKQGSTSFIEKNYIEIEIIPEPATMAIMAMGATVLAFSKKKKHAFDRYTNHD